MKKTKESNFNKKANRIRKNLIYLVVAIFIICILYTLYLMVIKATDTYIVEKGTIYFEESNVGYIIRNEVVIQGENYKNGIIQIASEGERVAKNEQIFRYYSNVKPETLEEIEKINLELQTALVNESSTSSPDIKLIDDQINKETEELSKISDIQEMEEYKKEINNLIAKKANIVGENSKSGSQIKQLINKKKELEKRVK